MVVVCSEPEFLTATKFSNFPLHEGLDIAIHELLYDILNDSTYLIVPQSIVK